MPDPTKNPITETEKLEPAATDADQKEIAPRQGLATQPFSCPPFLPEEITPDTTKQKPLSKPDNMPLETWDRLFDGQTAYLQDAAKK